MTAAPPLERHVFVHTGITNHAGAEQCGRCPFLDTRTDVHDMPETPAEIVAAEARRLGEHQEE